MIRFAWLLFVVGLGSCTPAPPAPPPPGGVSCQEACARLRELSCEDAADTPGKVPCETWLCGSYGVKSDCLARASTCEDAREKQVHGCP